LDTLILFPYLFRNSLDKKVGDPFFDVALGGFADGFSDFSQRNHCLCRRPVSAGAPDFFEKVS
jgi:hypothetical protein